MTSHQRASTLGYNDSPKEQSCECWGYDDSFDKKENPELLNRHRRQHGLKDPVDKKAQDTS